MNFKSLAWEEVAVGMCQKSFKHNNGVIRLVRFEAGFVEKEWCLKAHRGYVLEGSMSIAFCSEVITYKKGDVLFIEGGQEQRHKLILENQMLVELILFE